MVTMATRLLLSNTWLARRNFAITFSRRLRLRPVVHAIGDSHTEALQGVSPFVATWLGGATAYNLGNDSSSTGSKEKLEKALNAVRRRSDVVLIIVGEIDCRIHIYDQFMRRGGAEPVEALIDETIKRYGTVLRSVKARGYRVIVHSVPAAAHEENIYNAAFYADEPTRAEIVRTYNERLSGWCLKNGFEYLDMYRLVRDDSGFIREDLTEDRIHLGPAALPLYDEWARTL